MNAHNRNRPGFTLLETMLAVLIMALLAGGVAMSFAQPLRAARSEDAVDQVRSFDELSRQLALSSGRTVRMAFDLSNHELLERDGDDLKELRRRISLPPGCRVSALLITGHLVTVGEAVVDVSPHGWSRTYAVKLETPAGTSWLVLAGLTGQMTIVNNESQIPTFSPAPGHHAD